MKGAPVRPDVNADISAHLAAVEYRTRPATFAVEPWVRDSGGQVITEAVDRLRSGFRTLLEGGAGTGKTTWVEAVVHEMARAALNSESAVIPLLVPAIALPPPGDDLWMWLASAAAYGDLHLAKALVPALTSGDAYVFVDGLDEIGDPRQRYLVASALATACERSPTLKVCITSRPEGMSLKILWPEFSTWHLLPFGEAQIRKYFATLTTSPPAQIESELAQAPQLAALGTSLRTLHMLTLYSDAHGLSLPRNRARLYEDVIDALLEIEHRKVHRPFPANHVHAGYEAIAVAMALAGKTEMSLPEAYATLRSSVPSSSEEATQTFIRYMIERVMMLVQHAEGAMRFDNRSFQDFYLGKAIARDPALLDVLPATDLSEALCFAAGLATDAAPVVRAAYERHGLALAVSCCKQLQQDQTEIRSVLAHLVLDDLGEDFHPILNTLTIGPTPSPSAATPGADIDPFARLASMWKRMPRRGATADERGRGLEQFAVELLGQYFEVVDVRSRHQIGEVDIVCENPHSDPFWAHLSGDIWVECKNTASKATIEQVNTFIGKLVGSRCKVGLVLSVSGFTKDAIDRIKNLASNPGIPLVAPISGKDIDLLLEYRTEFQRFFKTAIRAVM